MVSPSSPIARPRMAWLLRFLSVSAIIIVSSSNSNDVAMAFVGPTARTARSCTTRVAQTPPSQSLSIPHTRISRIRPQTNRRAFSLRSRNERFQRGSKTPLNLQGGEDDSILSTISTTISSINPFNVISTLFSYDGHVPIPLAFGWNAILFAVLSSKLNKMLTPEGFAHSLALGTLLWSTLGWRGWTLCVLYLFLGSAVTKIRFEEKEKRGIAEGRGGRRGPENVWGSAATALICAACSVQGESFLGISSDLFVLGYVASLATKLADTFASEVGKAYGKTTFLITTLERVEPGTEGAISAEGTAAALVGGLLLPLYGLLVNLISLPAVAIATVAAFLATNAESLIGATIQGKEGFKWMTNEVVNFLNTLIGAVLAIFGGMIFLGMS